MPPEAAAEPAGPGSCGRGTWPGARTAPFVCFAGAAEPVATSFGAISERSSGGIPKTCPAGEVRAVLPCLGVDGVGAVVDALRGADSIGAADVGRRAGADGFGALGVEPEGVEGAFGLSLIHI